MKPFPLPALTLGLDVLSQESSLPKGAVRRATNVTLNDDGTFQLRPGHAPLTTLAGAHSFWRSDATTRVLCAAGANLYDVTLPSGAITALFTGLTRERAVEYDDVNADVFFTVGEVLRKIAPDGTIRTPGVADIGSERPNVSATSGNLYPARYGVAYSLVNDLGEESGISQIAWLDLPAVGGVTLSGLRSAPDAAKMKLYITAPNGPELYHHATRACSTTSSIVDQTLGALAKRQYLMPMPGGDIVRHHKGHLYVVSGKWLWISQPLDPNVCNVKDGWLTFDRTMTMFQPVDGGIFVGLREKTLFLRGSGPNNFELVHASDVGAFPHTGRRAPGKFFSAELAPSRDKEHAVWMSEAGMAIGRPDGSIVYPQVDRLTVAGDAGRPLLAQSGGIKQAVFTLESMTLGAGGATDVTI